MIIKPKLQQEGGNNGEGPPETPVEGPDRPIPFREAPLRPTPLEGPDREIIKGL